MSINNILHVDHVISRVCRLCNWLGCIFIGIICPLPPEAGTVTRPTNTLSLVFSCKTCTTKIIRKDKHALK